MRTRIALGATFGVVFIIVSALAPDAHADVPTTNTASTASVTTPAPPEVKQGTPAPDPDAPGYADAVLKSATTLLSAPPPVASPTSPPATVPPATVPPAPVPPATVADTVTPDQRAAWERVARCEEGGDWQADGSRFSGGLGISRANWAAYGGEAFAPEAAMATEDQQIMIGERIQASPPDQQGCRGW